MRTAGMEEYISFLPPPYPPAPVRVWKDRVPKIKCPFCNTIFTVSPGTVECPRCGAAYLVSDWDWNSFLIGLGLGLIIGLVISAGIYWFVLRPYVPLARLVRTLGETV